MISKEILSKIRKLEIHTKGLVNNIFSGEYQSAFKGRGMEFSEVREYTFGDDVRQIDWNVTARSSEPYIKVFEEEREQTLMLCVDISPSGYFGSHSQTKMELAIEICAVLAFSAIKNGDKVGLVLFSDKIEKVVPPKKGRTHVLRLIRELYTTEPDGTSTNIGEALSYVNRLLTRRSILVLASDFQDENFEKQHRITTQKHDLVNLVINDRLEEDLPDIGIVPFRDAETGKESLVDTSSKKVREAYRKRVQERKKSLQEYFLKNKMDSIDVYTNESYIKPLINFFQRRISRF
ncbi:DUF58 domain-containing protein [Rhodohalobacter sulfatireducens]|uniref:DUF58 domain-containing protein n=1 Tax=Rhodohalobacter sulfatireducens TaxID=2911366 RepID=A0ABS9KB22_9BACT|nr:DUF58 domain-containing protein [Rhodohalobacter sulfatireducens]MCG2588057.1 DUF58 domain-containing protein [Rhodohalobacter sulfatireducens]MDR9364091.1 DUF58 domain-containing protein [Balneolaceae bacterium]MDR9407363.1 DUF58 domain-containing protein [Balneolaceae bacterium]